MPAATPEVLEHPPSEAAVTPEPSLEDTEIFPIDERMFIREGLEDVTNRYSFTVMLTATITKDETRRCSGAVIAPRVVLTAAHCVCIQRKIGAPHSGLNCAERATVTTAFYDPSKDTIENLIAGRYADYEGTIRAHPDFKGFSRTQHMGAASPDLAIVMLDQPIASWVRPVRLAFDEPKPGELLTIVGYGQDETSGLTFKFRRFGKKKFLAFRNGQGLLEQQGLVALSSEGGVSCLSEAHKEPLLVGLISVFSDETPTFTHVSQYRDWLQSDLIP